MARWEHWRTVPLVCGVVAVLLALAAASLHGAGCDSPVVQDTILRDAVFQFAVPIETTRKRPARALLWIPPQAERLRGAVICGTTLMERDFVRDERIRAACRDERLALAILSCGLAQADVQPVLDDLAEVSGYGELRDAPLLFVGHSAGGPQAQRRAIELAPRCFGLIQYRGGMPSGSSPIPAGIPALATVGQFDEFGGTMRDESGVESWERGGASRGSRRARTRRSRSPRSRASPAGPSRRR